MSKFYADILKFIKNYLLIKYFFVTLVRVHVLL